MKRRWLWIIYVSAVALQVILMRPAPPPDGMEAAARRIALSGRRTDARGRVQPGQPAVDLVGWHRQPQPDRWTFVFEIDTGDRYYLLMPTMEMRDGRPAMDTVEVATSPFSLEQQNQFRFSRIRATHLLALLFACFSLSVSVGTAWWAAARGLGVGWQLLALVFVGQIAYNWSTGTLMGFSWTVSFFGADMYRPFPKAAWMLLIGLPWGAALVLQFGRYFAPRRDNEQAASGAGTPAPADSVVQGTPG